MRVEYENKFTDQVLFNAVHQFLSPVMQGLVLILFTLILVGKLNENDFTSAAITAFLWYVGLWAFQFAFNVVCCISRKNRTFFAWRTIEILDDSLLEQTVYNKSIVYWPGVVKVVSRPGFIGIYTSQHAAHIVPDRAFSSAEQRKKFFALLKEKINVAAPMV